jgi:hypothetical protein
VLCCVLCCCIGSGEHMYWSHVNHPSTSSMNFPRRSCMLAALTDYVMACHSPGRNFEPHLSCRPCRLHTSAFRVLQLPSTYQAFLLSLIFNRVRQTSWRGGRVTHHGVYQKTGKRSNQEALGGKKGLAAPSDFHGRLFVVLSLALSLPLQRTCSFRFVSRPYLIHTLAAMSWYNLGS